MWFESSPLVHIADLCLTNQVLQYQTTPVLLNSFLIKRNQKTDVLQDT